MTPWIFIAILAYLLFALNGIADKFLLTHSEHHPAVYVFYLGISSVFVFVLSGFGLHLISGFNLLLALAAGISFAYATLFFYSAIKQTSISRILPIEGGLVPIFSLILAYITRLERFDLKELVAFGLLVAGSVMMAFKKTDSGWHAKAWRNATIAAFLFALSFILTKYSYNHTNFISGLIWTRLGLAIGALSLLLSKNARKHILGAPKKVSTGNKLLFYSAALAGAGGSFLQNYAISIGSVVIVNALQGVQFVFVLILSLFLSEFYPKILKEEVNVNILIQKILAIVLITLGLLHL